MNGRDAALAALSAWRRSGAWADSYLRNTQLEPREAALARRLCFGVIQNRMLMDFYIGAFSKIPIKKMEPSLPDILRLAIYQIVFMDRIPPSAAVNEAVRQAGKKCSRKAVSFCNGVLRSIERARGELPQPTEDYIKYSHPKWLFDRFVQILGRREAVELMAANNALVPTFAQVNSLRAGDKEIQSSLNESGAKAILRGGVFEISGGGAIGELEAFKKGWIYIQDPAANRAIKTAAPEPGMTVIDGCAAPGGKSIAAAIMMRDKGRIIACDIHENKLGQIDRAAERLGIHIIETRLLDAALPTDEFIGLADLVIADVPCSGMGVIRKKPDIRYKMPEELKGLPDIQLGILKNLSKYVKPGGLLLYSTCTVLPEENGRVTKRFLETAPFQIREEKTLYPHTDGCDGFYICLMKRGDK